MFNIYLTNLGKYNEGELVGEWVSLPASNEEIKSTLDSIGINEEYEEWFITDYENDFGYEVGEYDNLDDLNEKAASLEALTEDEREIVNALLSYGYDLEEIENLWDDLYIFHDCNNMADVAEQYADETGLLDSMPENLRYYFDFEAFGRDMEIEGTFINYPGGYVGVSY